MADIQPMDQPKAPVSTKAKVGGGLIGGAAIALVMAIAGLKPDEGKSNYTYLDVANLPTECFGHLDRAAKVGTYHTDAQCDALLSSDAQKAENGVLRCTPGLATHPYQLAAATRLTFNIGVNAYCGSTVAKRFNVGQWQAACDGFAAWHYAGGRSIPGLVARRQRERAQCLTELPE